MKPFLKWAGNKYRIIQHIQAILETLPSDGRLIEPFAGSGAVFLNTHYSGYLLNDANADLITLYQTLQEQGPAFIEACRQYFIPANNQAERYYEHRETFNTTSDKIQKSALFIYLNRHCFNGLCRYNGQGGFNVPLGRYSKPYFPEQEMIDFYQKAQSATFQHGDFIATMQAAQPGDIVYCDPPYVPLSQTANFTSYSTGGFSMKQQQELATQAITLAKQGVHVLISNHDTAFTQQAYHLAQIKKLSVQRYISCNGENRGKADEVLALFTPPGEKPLRIEEYSLVTV